MAHERKGLLIFPQVASFWWMAHSLVSSAKACLDRAFMDPQGREQWTVSRSLAFTYFVSSSALLSSQSYSPGHVQGPLTLILGGDRHPLLVDYLTRRHKN